MKKAAASAPFSRPEVVAIYCPLWHNYDHASSWKGEGWCEWELLKAAKPRFPGHYQPYRPTWGHFDESDPRWSTKEISLAAKYGVDVFLVDWYWYDGVKIMEETLENGLLKAKNRDDIKIALMWANHNWADYFPAPFGQKWNSWLPSHHSPRDLTRVMEYCVEKYFRRKNYWRVEGEIFFSLFEPTRFVQEMGGHKVFRKTLAATNRLLAKHRLPPLHLNAMVWSDEHVDNLREAGFASTTSYNITTTGNPPSTLIEEYTDIIETHRHHWVKMAKASLPHVPVVTLGWDCTPRCETTVAWPFPTSPMSGNRDYPYWPVVIGNTPERFADLCRHSLEHCATARPTPNAVFVNAWNEWTEGCILLPEKRYGNGYLEAIRSVFGLPGERRKKSAR